VTGRTGLGNTPELKLPGEISSRPGALSGANSLDFTLPAGLEAAEPPEARGLARDQVRLMVSYVASGRIVHSAALNARRADGAELELHLSTHLARDGWSVELRLHALKGTQPFLAARAGERLALEGGAKATLLSPYPSGRGSSNSRNGTRLWLTRLDFPMPFEDYLEEFGFPIRYSYVKKAWPSEYYQTVYATQPGSAEMPSAGRAFTPGLITRLVALGVQIAPLLLHTGVASLESDEPPYPERYRVPPETAEQVTAPEGITTAGEGWTSLVITPQRGIYAVNGLLTGFHEPRSSHLGMLAALAGMDHLRQTYAQALAKGYLWHEFGDLHLILE
jgi:S-adenosylmethionine:tRNA ribosyltransferase-isomerase